MITCLEIERRRRGMTRKELAELLGRSTSRITVLESGKRGGLNGTGRRQIEKLFGRPWSELAAPVPPPEEPGNGSAEAA